MENEFKRAKHVMKEYSSMDFLKMYTLLAMINRGPCYVLEIINYIASFNCSWNPSHAQLYPVMKEFVEEGLVERLPQKNRRIYYKITYEGVRYYRDRRDAFRTSLVNTSKFYDTVIKEMSPALGDKKECPVCGKFMVEEHGEGSSTFYRCFNCLEEIEYLE